ncbi:MAG: sigma-54-dependent Fis family transcriptional regulator [Verrucomicrobia bacterium]|nr:MAG: sigma-54-dependent Fis family transcriptional regulator [Verrucomicrobiota bacterium]
MVIMNEQGNILIIDDKKSDAEEFERVLRVEGYEVETAATAEAGLARAKQENFDVVLTGLHLSGSDEQRKEGLHIVSALQAAKPSLAVILMTAKPTTQTTIEAMKLGAYDSIIKGRVDWNAFTTLIHQAVEDTRFQRERPKVPVPLAEPDAIIGTSAVMHAMYKQIGRLAAKSVAVLIRGETGTGKELVATALHRHSARHDKPFIIVNCAAISEQLLESELFGHEAGAFTDAKARLIGRFEQADQGSIFLDEIGDMSINLQSKLLRVLQQKTFQRVGGKETITVNVRVIAATHRDLKLAILEKEFREDLYYRLNVAVIVSPPLRERREDIPILVEYFMHRYGKELVGNPEPQIHADALDCLQEMSWPGNVRELENVVRRALVSSHGIISLSDVQEAIAQDAVAKTVAPLPAGDQPLTAYVADLLAKVMRSELDGAHARVAAAAEREVYSQAIQLAAGDQSKAAKWLGVSRPTMREKLLRYGLHPRIESATKIAA